jgi:hypothetical protein
MDMLDRVHGMHHARRLVVGLVAIMPVLHYLSEGGLEINDDASVTPGCASMSGVYAATLIRALQVMQADTGTL